ncbi:hypothetical protein BpHYR1_042278 [Brachionus plicatilis]|uniref:Uncharacterized protein n=1 Tax=Brachionus plicatilis TaxID=10195 RepID=A0A3M7R5L4_BRAPC|nr:hypothetical protein BpHYR1_042278 [Brachionus plicatilis]
MVNSRYFSFYNTSETRYETSNRATYRSVSPRYSNIDLHRSPSSTLADYKGILKNSLHNDQPNRYFYYRDSARDRLFHSKSSSSLNRKSVEIPIERVYSSRLNQECLNKHAKSPMINLDVAIQTPGSDIKISHRSKSYEVNLFIAEILSDTYNKSEHLKQIGT